jgi:transcriptional regulator with XRE-family HTH domain
MKFTERIKQLREQRQLQQRKFAAALDIDTATYRKIERGERKAKVEQIVIITDLLKADKDKLLTLWLVDQIAKVAKNNKILARNAMKIISKNTNKFEYNAVR